MSFKNTQNDDYDMYAEQFDPTNTDRQARRRRKPKIKHTPKKAAQDIVAEITNIADDASSGLKTTYTPARYEEMWLMSSLQPFFDQDLITDVIARVKGGKEASVYCCEAHPSLGVELVAAKVYRPRMFRQLRNDKMYRENRTIITEDGKDLRAKDHRTMRAIQKGSSYGSQVTHTSWLLYEYNTLQKLHSIGATVPLAYATGENAILMTYIGDEGMAAPALVDTTLTPQEVTPLFDEVLRNIELMLRHGMIHGDLSAYNILYWEGQVTLIDFPQVTNANTNPHARMIFDRDVQRVCEYFADQGDERDPQVIAHKLWKRYMKQDKKKIAADLSRLLEPPEED